MNSLLQNPNFIYYAAGGFVLLIIIAIAAMSGGDPAARRLKNIHNRREALRKEYTKKSEKKKNAEGLKLGKSIMRQISSWMKLQQLKGLDEVRQKLIRAGYRSRDALLIFLFAQIALPIIIFILLAVFLFVLLPAGKLTGTMSLLICLFFSILTGLLPNLIIKNQTQKRLEQIRKDLPDAFDLLVICAEAGLSLDAALDRVGRETQTTAPEISDEITLTCVELSFMPERAPALRALSDRVDLPGIKALVSTLIQTEKYGTPLAQALRILSTELRDERMMRAEEKAAKLPAVLTVPMILFILPPLFVVLIGPAIISVIKTAKGIH